MSTPRVVGIGGLLASGKDTVADYLVEKHGWVKMGMSDPLAHALYTLNPYVVTYEHISHPLMRVVLFAPGTHEYRDIIDEIGYTRAKEIPEVRRLLQVLGTEVGRNQLGETIWTDTASRRISEQVAEGKSVILTGIRFPNEIEMIHYAQRGELWWVHRPIAGQTGKTAQHASETTVSPNDFDIVIQNDSTLEHLYSEVDRLLEEGGSLWLGS